MIPSIHYLTKQSAKLQILRVVKSLIFRGSTRKVGFYQFSHMDETHNPNWKPESNSTPVHDPDPTLNPPLCPPSTSLSNLDDDLVFTGVHYALVFGALYVCDEREKTYGASEGEYQQNRHLKKKKRIFMLSKQPPLMY